MSEQRASRGRGWTAVLALALLVVTAPAVGLVARNEPAYARALEQAEAHFEEGRDRRAAATYREANQLADEKLAAAWIGLANTYQRMGKHHRAAEAARRALGVAATSTEQAAALYLLGTALYGWGTQNEEDLAAAEEALSRAIASSGGDFPKARFVRAVVLGRQGKLLEAAREAKAVLEREAPEEVAIDARVLFCEITHSLEAEDLEALSPDGSLDPERLEVPARDGTALGPRAKIYHSGILYPRRALWRGVEGPVVLGLIIDRYGCVRDVEILQQVDARLAHAARRRVEHWVYMPGTVAGEPHPSNIVVKVEFRLR